MKKTKMFMLALVCLMMQSVACFADVLPIPDDDKPIAAQQLPAAVKTFIQQYFPKLEVAYAEIMFFPQK
ncbi:MAG: hypothetical protein IJV06_12600 [Bacteroidaceae bacterium]|nr:hypothetical protein [Bacteroidaceae bacterium]MBQ9642370.1 hypothetical protein [Bacteroidaceae bacterium]